MASEPGLRHGGGIVRLIKAESVGCAVLITDEQQSQRECDLRHIEAYS
jgi:hypothetical protein